ncbi:sensor histidine kinase [Herbiconiux ginsengi]|uniref:Signal transduction histidine kinase n=1 Tax=Herbiconiux ginsengi TaxID=381665 RepID=A0A1H3U557_9MICO|nr:ATP-binding protein [Herbiconiux ginsengi]SDZ57624.1 Signal transduction histidine kinase [Herbiconiux ginsengi]
MTLQIAADVDGVATSRALARAGALLACVFLGVTMTVSALFIPVTGHGEIVVGLGALLVTGIGVVGALHVRRFAAAVALTLLACAGLYLFALIATGVSVQVPGPTPSSDYVLLSMPEFAVLVVGISARSLRKALALGSLAFVAGPGFVQVAAWQQGMPRAVDIPVIASYFALGLFVTALWLGRRDAARGTAVMSGAALAEERDVALERFSTRASSWLHDTVLSDLRALAATEPGPLDSTHAQAIDRDLANLADVRLILDAPGVHGSATRALVAVPALVGLVRDAEQKGLRIRVGGDVPAINALSFAVTRNLERAITECLDNVLAHSGVREAEISVMSSPSELSVMVSDSGVGFEVNDIAEDRIGLRVSVVDAIADIGGSVQIWSRPGAGTAVFMTVPGGQS